MTAQVNGADDEALLQFVRGLIRNSVMEMEARDAGHQLTRGDYASLKETLAQEIGQLRRLMGLDSALASAGPQADRRARPRAAGRWADRFRPLHGGSGTARPKSAAG